MTFALCLIRSSPAAASDKKDYDREIARQRKELDELRDRLQSEQKELEFLREKRESTLGTLDKIAGNIKHTEQYLSKLDATEETLNSSLGAVRQELREVEARIGERNNVMARRVRTLFMSGSPDRLVLRGWEAGHGDFMRKVFFMKRVLRYDRSLVDAGREDAALKQKAMSKLDARIAEVDRFRAHKAQEKETYSRARTQQERNLAAIQSDEAAKQRALQELEENARLITDIIAALEKRRKEELARNKKATVLETGSKYCLPVDGEVVSKYGLQYHATLKTTTKNLGIEIRGAAGAPVRAAVSGEIALITRIPGYGMGVILDNGSDFFTIYANLAGIRARQGDKVKTCQELGTVSVESGKVYFEVRKGTKTLDPSEWLRSGGK
ncbi:MAG TPA: peptidoglycan DD-metalloendopeptidase family protein [Fibrobacteria bacterium]|nr:peptidoglycan DD-metalloendopeptidase family protein [Fibrobacteria bacterium]